MTLLVTVLLMMIGFAATVGEDSPSMNTVSALDIWLLGKRLTSTVYLILY